MDFDEIGSNQQNIGLYPIFVPNIILKKPKRILLVEPGYKAKYPPLGLMKIATFHKDDDVTFYKGARATIRDQEWDAIYITSMFTFQWDITIETIKFYQRGRQKNKNNIKVGGILATLLPDDLEQETGIKPHVGLWDEVDRLMPDYTLNGLEYYSINNASFGYTTKGCHNGCPFCAVKQLEPNFVDFIPLAMQVIPTKKDLILLDNNVLASKEFPHIIEEIKRYGFFKKAKFRKGYRYVDFNQGIDARLLDDETMELLSQLPINPLRIAFDDIKFADIYSEKIRLAHRHGITNLSNYILFNYKDSPEDFYKRLQINIELNEELGLHIFSFPMRYIPLKEKNRRYISPEWTASQLRGVQCILHATHGVVGPKRSFFQAAFGHSPDEFNYIINQPEDRIFNRGTMIPFNQLGELARME